MAIKHQLRRQFLCIRHATRAQSYDALNLKLFGGITRVKTHNSVQG